MGVLGCSVKGCSYTTVVVWELREFHVQQGVVCVSKFLVVLQLDWILMQGSIAAHRLQLREAKLHVKHWNRLPFLPTWQLLLHMSGQYILGELAVLSQAQKAHSSKPIFLLGC